jgi:hypothetical protein
MRSGTVVQLGVAIAAAVAWCLGCSSTKRSAEGPDAGAEAGEDGGACPDAEPGPGVDCTGAQVDCPYCGNTFCSCTPAGFWQCAVVLQGDGGACTSVEGAPVPQEGAACAQACGPYVADTCSFVCPGGQGPVSAECESTGWHVLGSCGGDAGGD